MSIWYPLNPLSLKIKYPHIPITASKCQLTRITAETHICHCYTLSRIIIPKNYLFTNSKRFNESTTLSLTHNYSVVVIFSETYELA